MDELMGKNLVMPKYMKNEENEEDVESILDITEVFTEKLDASDGNDEVEENKIEVEVDELLDKQKEVEEKEIEVINENLDLEVKDEYNDNPGAGKVTTLGEEKSAVWWRWQE